MSRSLVCAEPDDTDSDTEHDNLDDIPGPIKRNRDFTDLMWALCCRNCCQAVDAQGYCYCTHQDKPEDTSKKQKIDAVYDLTTNCTKVIDLLK